MIRIIRALINSRITSVSEPTTPDKHLDCVEKMDGLGWPRLLLACYPCRTVPMQTRLEPDVPARHVCICATQVLYVSTRTYVTTSSTLSGLDPSAHYLPTGASPCQPDSFKLNKTKVSRQLTVTAPAFIHSSRNPSLWLSAGTYVGAWSSGPVVAQAAACCIESLQEVAADRPNLIK